MEVKIPQETFKHSLVSCAMFVCLSLQIVSASFQFVDVYIRTLLVLEWCL